MSDMPGSGGARDHAPGTDPTGNAPAGGPAALGIAGDPAAPAMRLRDYGPGDESAIVGVLATVQRGSWGDVRHWRWKHSERHFGSFRRVIELPDEADPEQISADCRNGVLTLHVPKSKSRQPKQIRVKAAGDETNARMPNAAPSAEKPPTVSKPPQSQPSSQQRTSSGEKSRSGSR